MSFFIYALKHRASQNPDNRDVEQHGLIRLCGQCLAWHIPIIGITPMHLLEGMSKKRHTRAPYYEAHDLEDIKVIRRHSGVLKKDIPTLIHQVISQWYERLKA